MRTIDRGGGGRHFTVSAGQTLTVELLRLHNGAVSTSYCSSPYTACGGGIAHVSGSNAVLRFQDAWLSGGRACYGGGVLAYGGAHVYLNRTSISANGAGVSVCLPLSCLCASSTYNCVPESMSLCALWYVVVPVFPLSLSLSCVRSLSCVCVCFFHVQLCTSNMLSGAQLYVAEAFSYRRRERDSVWSLAFAL